MLYDNNNRGKIQHRERARQIIDFSGLRFGNITPTDIDGLIEYKDIAYIFYGYKLVDIEMPKGQRLALERIADNLQKAGKQATIFVCVHNVTNPQNDIQASEAIVREFYYCGKWIRDGRRTAKDITNSFLSMVRRKKPF